MDVDDMHWRVFRVVLLLCLANVLALPCWSQEILINGSFESGMGGWTANPYYPTSVVTSYLGVRPAAGTRFLVLAGPQDVGYTYATVVSQSRSAPFATGVPSDNFLVYLSASVYLHTNDGRDVSYTLTLEPGYGEAGSSFHGGAQDAWVAAQTWGYYVARDPLDAGSSVKPIVVGIQLRDPLQAGEYLLIDDVSLSYGGPGIPEPSSLMGLIVGFGLFITKARRWERGV